MTTSAYAANPSLSVCDKGTVTDGYSISYGVNSSENVEAGDPPVILFVNGNAVSDGKAIIKNGTTLVPLRVISNRLNASVTWNSSTKTANISYGSTSIQATVGNSYITVNGKAVSTSAPTQIIDSTSYVPLRAIASAFGADVGYDGDCFEYVKVVWVQNTSKTQTISASKAVDIAEDVFFNKFLPTERDNLLSIYGLDTNSLTSSNINQMLQSKIPWDIPNFICSYEADLGEYYYVKYFDDYNYGILIDKYDGSFFAVSSYSIGILNIHGQNDYVYAWSTIFY